jgi:membrane fusion protein (multidrug efflux system)
MIHRVGPCLALTALAIATIATTLDAAGQDAGKPAVAPPSVTVVAVVEKDIRPSISFTGRVEAIDKVDLRARVDGFLEKKLFHRRTGCQAGDLLFVMEKGQYEAAVAQAQGKSEAAQALLSLADMEVKRQTDLVAKSAAPQSQLDLARAKQQQATGQMDQLNAALTQAEAQPQLHRYPHADCRTHRSLSILRRKFHRSLEQSRWRRSSARIPST